MHPAAARPLSRPARGGPRPWAREPRARSERRLSRRLAAGLTPAQAAAAEGVPAAEVEALLADPEFAGLVEAYREIESLPEAEARARLLSQARRLLEEAVTDGDVRAALLIWREERRGRDPAATLADGVIAAARRAAPAVTADGPPASPPPPTRPRPPADPADRAAWRTAERLRAALLAERAALHRAAAEERDAGALSEPAGTRPALTPALSHLRRGRGHGTRATVFAPSPVPPGTGEGRGEAGAPPPDRPGTPQPEHAAQAPPPGPNRHQRRRLAALSRRRVPPRTTGGRGPP